MAENTVPLTTFLSALFLALVVNIYVIALAFGLAASVSTAIGRGELGLVLSAPVATLTILGTVLVAVRSSAIRFVDDLRA